jgi:hypothetical protein
MKWVCAFCLLAALALAGCTMTIQTPTPQPQEEMSGMNMGGESAMSDEEKIANAMSAAPDFISTGATVIDFDASGALVTLQEGTNGWTCLPDNPGSPTNDPMCGDAMWIEWLKGYSTGAEPNITAPGIAYMLQGESGASNSDPSLTEPPAGEDWIEDGPHIMVLLPEPLDQAVFTTTHLVTAPYIMFGGTPYEHLMVPVETVAAQPADDKIANAMSAAPAAIAENATLVDFDPSAGFVTLREGTNGWTCLPDNPGSPTDDPLCGDAMWMKWLEAYFTGAEPEITSPGIAYMLQGESGASNSDPTLMEPPAGEDWIVDGPHVMLLLPAPFDQTIFSTEHGMSEPYLMFAGTPYEHMMIPLAMPMSMP